MVRRYDYVLSEMNKTRKGYMEQGVCEFPAEIIRGYEEKWESLRTKLHPLSRIF